MEPVVTPSLTQDRAPTCTPLDLVRKEELADAQGRLYKEFRQQLRPRFAKVWVDLLPGHAILAITAVATVLMERAWPQGWILESLVCAVLVGYFSAYASSIASRKRSLLTRTPRTRTSRSPT